MHRGVALAALCVGCYAPAYSPGTPCESECPGNLVCIDHVCREPGFTPADAAPNDTTMVTIDAPLDGPTIDGPPGDVDADGVLDNTDNCPAASNADQHDEDADARGDVCDVCPHLAGNQVDGDGDKVGDACDPQPAIAKQRIAFFDPFTTNKSEWDHSSGVSRVGETLRANGATTAFTRLMVPNAESRIMMSGTIASVSSTTPHQVSLAYGLDAAGDVYHYSEFYDSSGSGGVVATLEANMGTYTSLASAAYAGAMPAGAWSMRVDSSVAAQTVVLDAKLGGVTYQPLTASTSAAPALTTSVLYTLFIRNVDVRIDYVIVIETMP